MNNIQWTLELIKIISSILTPLIILLIGIVIAKRIEKIKLSALKEKEWQVKWAEMFLKHATDFNDNITIVICSLFNLQTEDEKKKVDAILNTISDCNIQLSKIDWNIRNYSQFSKNYMNEVIENQQRLMESVRNLISERKGNLEELRKLQFNYNDTVRKAHGDILNMV